MADIIRTHKACSICKEDKPLKDFYVKRSVIDFREIEEAAA